MCRPNTSDFLQLYDPQRYLDSVTLRVRFSVVFVRTSEVSHESEKATLCLVTDLLLLRLDRYRKQEDFGVF